MLCDVGLPTISELSNYYSSKSTCSKSVSLADFSMLFLLFCLNLRANPTATMTIRRARKIPQPNPVVDAGVVDEVEDFESGL